MKARTFEKLLIGYLKNKRVNYLVVKARDLQFLDNRHLTTKSVGQMLKVISRKSYYGLSVSSDNSSYSKVWEIKYDEANNNFR